MINVHTFTVVLVATLIAAESLTFDTWSGPVSLENLNCSGFESSLTYCGYDVASRECQLTYGTAAVRCVEGEIFLYEAVTRI